LVLLLTVAGVRIVSWLLTPESIVSFRQEKTPKLSGPSATTVIGIEPEMAASAPSTALTITLGGVGGFVGPR